ncbi:hypothetical protein GC173_01980 [bacterium]|nr:hypothetical protein [bacterium]
MLQYWRVFLFTLALLAVGGYQLYGVFSNEGYAPQQPIPFSHALHAGVMKMECLYCHSTAETGPHAGVPQMDLCMGCHSIVRTDSPYIQKLTEYYEKGQPVPWVRIHKLPDHAFFNHQWHIAAGVACQTCHGPIQEMNVVGQWQKLEMGACMQCHRQDTYVDSINHPPTYHEAPYAHGDHDHAHDAHGDHEHEDHAKEAPATGEFASVTRHLEKYGTAGLSAEEAEQLKARLVEYKKDIYYHGRGAQLRGKNASVECSTCHY